MDKRYQVFVSSTKEDLEAARQTVSEALLRARCFPAAMELFPAADAGVSDYIRQKIDESDYMVLILAGRYGSVNPDTGLSFTEEEYDHAVATAKPVIRLVHKSPFETLPGARIDQDPDARQALERFRNKVTSTRIARLWENERELGAEVVLGILDAQERHPGTGWVRADTVLDGAAALELADLREKVREFERETPSPLELLNRDLARSMPITTGLVELLSDQGVPVPLAKLVLSLLEVVADGDQSLDRTTKLLRMKTDMDNDSLTLLIGALISDQVVAWDGKWLGSSDTLLRLQATLGLRDALQDLSSEAPPT
ncbi:MAG: DUF4062 domain-containing protein [Pseudomonadota bacterium]